MKLISNDNGRAIQAFVSDEIQPRRGLYLPDFVRQVAERYGITKQPNVDNLSQSGASFGQGRLISGDKKINIFEMKIYNDSVIVTAKNTDDANFVLNDVIAWYFDTFDVPEPISKYSRSYISNLVVEFESPIDEVLKIFSQFGQSLSEAINECYGVNEPIYLSRFALGPDLKPSPNFYATEFLIERRIGHPFSGNRFYCSAPLPTDNHVALLEELERLVVNH